MAPTWGRQDPGGNHVGPWTLLSGRAWRAGGHYWNCYLGCSVFKSSHCSSCEDRAPVDEIYGCAIVTWVAETWLRDSNGCKADFHSGGLTHRGRDKIATTFQTTLLKGFSWNENVWLSNQQYPSVCLNNGLAPTKLQAIIWTNDV